MRAQVSESARTIIEGDEESERLSVSRTSDDLGVLMLKDTCEAMERLGKLQELELSRGDCEELQDGVFTQGVDSVLSDMTRSARMVIAGLREGGWSRLLNDPSIFSAAERLASLDESIIHDALDLSSDAFADVTLAPMRRLVGALVATAIVSIIIFLVLYVWLYRPTVVASDRDSKRARSMLLMLPEDVIREVPGLRSYVLELQSKASNL